MSDPIYLRNTLSSTIYADQINTAHLSGQQAARERSAKISQEAIRHEHVAVQKSEDSGKLDIREQEKRREQKHKGQRHASSNEEAVLEGESDSNERLGHIDLTV